MGRFIILISVLSIISFFLLVLVLTRGCPIFVQSIGRFYPERDSLDQKGAFEPSIKFFEATGVGEEKRGISVPTIICPRPSYAANSVRISVADVTKTRGYGRFSGVFFTLFKIEYDSGDVSVFVSPASPTREFDVCDGGYADCGMDIRHMPEPYRLEAKEDVIVTIEGVSISGTGEREEFKYRQKWVYNERLIVKSFSEAIP